MYLSCLCHLVLFIHVLFRTLQQFQRSLHWTHLFFALYYQQHKMNMSIQRTLLTGLKWKRIYEKKMRKESLKKLVAYATAMDFSLFKSLFRKFTYRFSYILFHIFFFHGYITNSHNNQLPVGLTAQLVRVLHRYCWVMGWIPLKPEFFFNNYDSLEIRLQMVRHALNLIYLNEFPMDGM